MKTYPLRTFVHRVLLIRLIIATLLISLAIATMTYFALESVLTRQVTDLARKGLEVVAGRVQVVMRSRSMGAADALRTLSGEQQVSTMYASGRFVLVQFYDSSLQPAGEWLLKGDEGAERYRAVLAAEPLARLPPGQAVAKLVKTGDQVVVRLSMPLVEEGKVLAYARGVFALSPETAAEIPRMILSNILYVLAIVLTVAAILYPVIFHLMRRLADYSTSLLDANLETLAVLGSAIAKRDSDTDAHNYRVSLYSARIGEVLGLGPSEMQSLVKGAFLHDVGKIGIPDNILLKPGRLDEGEFSVMKTHVDKGVDIVGRSSWLRDAIAVAGSHHEKYAGGGYPQGLRGAEIPITARIFAVADVFDALTSERPYKKPLPFVEAMEILEQGKGSHFDPQVLDAFSTVARELHDRYGGHEGSDLRQELVALVERCFSSGMEVLRYGRK